MKILLAEDERDLSRAICAILAHHRYQVEPVYDGLAALDHSGMQSYDGMILDIMMPKMDGLTALKKMREQNITTPVMLLTAKSELEDRVAGLDTGADDYLCKPFAMEELLARLRAMTRRKSEYTPDNLEFDNIRLDRATYELSNGSSALCLSNKEFQVMELLMARQERLISVDQFMEQVWGEDTETESTVVWVYISYLRKKLAALGAGFEIAVVRGAGYRLELKK